jgi:hypothetical protein
MNYASVITIGVVVFSLLSVQDLFAAVSPSTNAASRIWYVLGGRTHYKGPVSNLPKAVRGDSDVNFEDEKDEQKV